MLCRFPRRLLTSSMWNPPAGASGILVRKTGHTLTAGMAANVVGTVHTDATTGERYVSATSAVQNGSATVKPLAINIKAMGGGPFGLQDGTSRSGLRPGHQWPMASAVESYDRREQHRIACQGCGQVPVYRPFDIRDQRWLAIRADLRGSSGMTVDSNWDNVSVTGVSSCYKSGSDVLSRLRLRNPPDLMLNKGAMMTGTITGAAITSYNQTVQSAHPYVKNFDYTWTITGPANATRMRVHFTQMQTETNYDMLYVMDAGGAIVQTFSSSSTTTDVWSAWVNGSVVKLRLKTDASIQNYGFLMDRYEADANTGPAAGVTVTLTPGNLTATTDANGVFLFRNLVAGTYTVTPSAAGVTFTPVNYASTVTFGQYVSGRDFVAR